MGVEAAYAIGAIYAPAAQLDKQQNWVGLRMLPWFGLLIILLVISVAVSAGRRSSERNGADDLAHWRLGGLV